MVGLVQACPGHDAVGGAVFTIREDQGSPPLLRRICRPVQWTLLRVNQIFYSRRNRRLRLGDIRQILFQRPAAAERPEKPDEGLGLYLSRLDLVLLEAIFLTLGVENIQIIRQAAIIALSRNPRRLARGRQGAVEIGQTLLLPVKGRAGVVDLLNR